MSMTPITTILGAAATYDLTNLAATKVELGLDGMNNKADDWLQSRITEISRAIAKHVKRTLVPEFVQDYFPARQWRHTAKAREGHAGIQLNRWPVLGIASVVETLDADSSPSTRTLVEGVDFIADPDTGELLRISADTGRVTSWPARPITVQYTAGYGVPVSVSATIPAVSPYTITPTADPALSCVQSVAYANGTAFTAVAASPARGQYVLASGVFTFAAADEGQAIDLVYATIDVPDDLVGITLRLITARYKAKDRDPALIQQDQPGLGTMRYWFGGVPGQEGQFPPDIAAALRDYREPQVA